jgi:hypothetical protein
VVRGESSSEGTGKGMSDGKVDDTRDGIDEVSM